MSALARSGQIWLTLPAQHLSRVHLARLGLQVAPAIFHALDAQNLPGSALVHQTGQVFKLFI